MEFGGERGFAEMLYSLTDNEHLLREGHLQVTQEFVDSYTSLVKVVAPFFAPDAGVMAVVTIYASLLSPTGVKFSYSIDFFNMLRYYSHALQRLMLYSCFTHALLMLCSCFAHALLMLYSCFTICSCSIDFFNIVSGTRLDEYLVFEGISLCLSLVIVAMACYRIFKVVLRTHV